MSPARIGVVSGATGLALGLLALLAAAMASLPAPAGRVEIPRTLAAAQLRPQRPDSVVAVAVARDPFRMTRRTPVTPYDPRRAGQTTALPPGPPKPALRLVGLVRGAPMAAIVEGCPGVDGGRVIRAGDTIGPLRVVRLTAGGVRIVGPDTTWTLTLRVR